MFVFGGVEQFVQDVVVQVDDFVGDGGYVFDGKCYQGGIVLLCFEFGQVGGCYLVIFMGDFEQVVLVY